MQKWKENFIGLVTSCELPRPLINIPTGAIRGTYKKSEGGRVYAAFEGIPYARPPVGKYRFRVSFVIYFIQKSFEVLIILGTTALKTMAWYLGNKSFAYLYSI